MVGPSFLHEVSEHYCSNPYFVKLNFFISGTGITCANHILLGLPDSIPNM